MKLEQLLVEEDDLSRIARMNHGLANSSMLTVPGVQIDMDQTRKIFADILFLNTSTGPSLDDKNAVIRGMVDQLLDVDWDIVPLKGLFNCIKIIWPMHYPWFVKEITREVTNYHGKLTHYQKNRDSNLEKMRRFL